MKNLLSLLLLTCLFIACEKESQPGQLRIQNNTPFEIENAILRMGTSENTYTGISPNQVSEYKPFHDSGYLEGKFRLDNRDLEFKIQPIDQVPDPSVKSKPHPKTTCVLTYNADRKSFDMHFTR